MTEETSTILAQYIADNIIRQSNFKVEPHTRLLTTGLVDSLSITDLAFFVEERFGVRMKPAELNAQTFDTLGELVSLIEARKNSSARKNAGARRQ